MGLSLLLLLLFYTSSSFIVAESYQKKDFIFNFCEKVMEMDGENTVQTTSGKVYIKDIQSTKEKLERFITDGPSNLQIISDFDYTLTKFWLEGKKGASTHGIMEECNLLTDEYHSKAKALAKEYYPMEVDPNLPYDVKYEKMVEWWEKAHEALLEGGLTLDKLKGAVSGANIRLREGCQELFSKVESDNIPMLIFSAGLADVIEEVLRQLLNQPVPPGVHVVSNHMSFNEQGALTGFQEPLFHIFNKNAGAILHLPFFCNEDIQNRRNVLLLGDSPGDADMATGLEDVEVLRIGYLNDRMERLEQYQDLFDVVITCDGDLSLVLAILTRILKASKINNCQENLASILQVPNVSSSNIATNSNAKDDSES